MACQPCGNMSYESVIMTFKFILIFSFILMNSNNFLCKLDIKKGQCVSVSYSVSFVQSSVLSLLM